MLGKSRLKYIQSLGQKKVRDEAGVFIAEGPKLIAELLTSGNMHVQEIFSLKEWTKPPISGNKSNKEELCITEITADELGKISQLSTPNQVLAIIKKPDTPLIQAANKLVLALDTIQDPGNLGTIVRIADWFGLTDIVCSRDCADIFNPKVVQATMGSIARVAVLYTDLAEWIGLQKNIPLFAAVLDGERVMDVSKPKEGILIIGNESKGISPQLLTLVNRKITIPGKGKAESLNAAVATGILLSHLVQ
jgi:RNA methyltransferase, TrmH family